jgi:hypothetical protein
MAKRSKKPPDFIEEVEAVQWSVFFLVPTGRAQAEWIISAEEHERVFNWLYDLSKTASFDIKATAAPMYRRVAIERKKAESGEEEVSFQGAGFQYADGLNRPRKGVNDGNGFLFISHLGEIEPSGFLPISAGNVRKDDVVEVYRTITPDWVDASLKKEVFDAHVLAFTSPSTVRGFLKVMGSELAKELLEDKIVASIGPITSQALRGMGFRVDVEARGMARGQRFA